MFENSYEMLRTRPRFVPISSVKGRLAATSLIFGKLDFVSNPAQHLDRVNCNLRQQLVHEAWHEERYFLLHAFSQILRSPALLKMQRRMPSGLRRSMTCLLLQGSAYVNIRSRRHQQLTLPLGKSGRSQHHEMPASANRDGRWRVANIAAVKDDLSSRRSRSEIALYRVSISFGNCRSRSTSAVRQIGNRGVWLRT